MPRKNTRLVALLACFTGLIFLSGYEPRSLGDMTVGLAAGILCTVATVLALSLMDF
jgi:hypothetical protein